MKYRFTVAALLVLASYRFSPGVAADVPTPPAGDTTAYRLMAGDQIAIKVLNFPDLGVQATIPPDGKITLPLLDPVSVTGETVPEVTRTLTQLWSRYVLRPDVSVTLVQARARTVVLYGFAAKPGPLEYRRGLHLVDAIAQGGGAAPNGDLSRVTITHGNGTKQVLDLSHPETKGGSAADVELQPDDTIYVPERQAQFSVLGEVARAGSYDFKENMTVLDALTAVGGVTANADLAAATLQHNGTQSSLDLKALLNGDLTRNQKLSPGDAITVPLRRAQFSVLGEVGHPGSFDFKDEMTVLDAITQVGGVTDSADLGSAVLIHGGAETRLDLKKLLQDHDLSLNVKLSPGDAISVPSRVIQFGVLGQVHTPGRFPYRDGMTVLDALTVVGGVADTADLDHATLIHQGQETPINLRALLREGNLALNTTLSPGDVISVPQRTTQFTVVGEVTRPGSFDYKDDMTAMDALTTAGGVKETADLDNATLGHNGQTAPLDLRALLEHGDLSHNAKLAAGDVITVPVKGARQYTVLGEVHQPGSFAYKDNMTVLDALTQVGGINDATADLSGASLEHNGQDSKLDLAALLQRGDLSLNVKLSPGDRILVPELRDRNYIFGAVQKPGYYAYRDGDHLLDAINGAGGAAREGNLAQINVIHVDRAKNTATVRKVDLSKFLTKADMSGNVALQPGDVIFVPDRKKSVGIGDIFGALTGLNIVSSTVRLLGIL